MSPAPPTAVHDKIAALPETSDGANRVTLAVKSGRTIHEVAVAWGKDVVRVGGKTVGSPSDLDLDPQEAN
jgi:hypothetical protein